jgi:multisubunit Na+/H+ antiporter MnhB subunit
VKRDLREYAKQTDRRLVVGAILILFLAGGGLIWWFYGTGAAGLALTCMLGGVSIVALIVLIFYAIDKILKSARPK